LDEDGNTPLLHYETVRDLLQAKAEERVKNPLTWLLGVLLITAAGLFGLWQKRKQQQAPA